MNLVTYNITLDYHEIAAQALFLMKKADTARRIVATLSEGGDPYEIAPACYALFTAYKPNGGVVTLNCEISDNSIICDITEAITALPGKVDCEIKLYDATGDMLTSPKFGIIVDDVVFNNGDDVEEGGEYPAIVYAVGIDSVEQTIISTEDGGTNVLTVTLTDGSKQTVSIRNGAKGKDGYTPIKGKDYFDGKDGDPGVYIGDDEPSNANVWIDTAHEQTFKTETWQFELDDGTIVTKKVLVE